MARRKTKKITKLSQRLTGGKLSLGGGRRKRRSRRLGIYESSQSFALPKPRPALEGVRRRWWLMLLPLALAGLLYLMFGTHWFYVYDIELIGTQQMSKEEIYQRSQLEALSIFWLNPLAVQRRLLEEPTIEHADVSWRLPAHVTIRIVERQPAAVWQSGEVSLLADTTGTLFRPRGDVTNLLVVRDLSNSPVVPGDTVDAAVVQAVAALAAAVPERTAFDWEPTRGLSFVSDDGWRVNFGDQHQVAVKVAAYQAFREQAQPDRKVVMLDLSNPKRPYFQVEP